MSQQLYKENMYKISGFRGEVLSHTTIILLHTHTRAHIKGHTINPDLVGIRSCYFGNCQIPNCTVVLLFTYAYA